MKRSIIISLHVGYWLVFIFLTVSTLVVAGNNFKGSAYMSFFLNTLLAVSCFYSFYFILVPKFLAKRKIKLFVLSAIGVCLMSSVVMHLIHILKLRSANIEHPNIQSIPSDTLPVIMTWVMTVFFHVILGMVHGLLATFMKGFFMWYDEIHIKELLERKNIETQMALIKARINPHFLFNTLNNIDALIKSNAALASIFLQKLSNIMRFALYDNQPDRIALEKEVSIMREYIELESIRATNKDFISFEVTGNASNIQVAPMLFIPFLENAIKHSGNRKVNDVVEVKVDIMDDETISFLCRNVIAQKQQGGSNGGLGIELIKQRLNLIYPGKHKLVIQNENEYFEVKLTVDTR